jgi:hypothetical protein
MPIFCQNLLALLKLEVGCNQIQIRIRERGIESTVGTSDENLRPVYKKPFYELLRGCFILYFLVH